MKPEFRDRQYYFLPGVLILVSLMLWCFLFRHFLDGTAQLQNDAYPYMGHMWFYVENLAHGVYPLWHPFRENGNINEFFMRRIGEFNPAFSFLAIVSKLGVPFLYSHRIFLVFYFLLAVVGFYLLSRQIFKDQRVSLTAAGLFLFSSLGANIFETFVILEMTPYLWFAYFLVSFARSPNRFFALGMTFCLMIINITYLPFYFYCIFGVFLVLYALVYFQQLNELKNKVLAFINVNRLFTLVCGILLALSLIPGALWYQSARQAEAYSNQRHAGSDDSHSATVGIAKINEGGISPYFIAGRQFFNLDKLDFGDFYIPLFAFLLLLAGVWAPINRRLVLFFIFGFVVYLIGLADASVVHKFLYSSVPLFKYFRNLQFFLWFVILPVTILFVCEQMKIFVQRCEAGLINRRWMTIWIFCMHSIILWFLMRYEIKNFSTYVTVVLSFVWMTALLWQRLPVRTWALILWAVVVLQPFEAFSRFAILYPAGSATAFPYDYQDKISLPSTEKVRQIQEEGHRLLETSQPVSSQPYFAVRWYYDAISNIRSDVFVNYIHAPFIAYDRVEYVENSNVDFSRLVKNMASFENIVFVHEEGVNSGAADGAPRARIITSNSDEFKVIRYNANDIVVKSSFSRPVFLVRTGNYHSLWNAFIDSEPAKIIRSNVFAQGLWVPAGEHTIRWMFGAPWRYWLAYFLIILYALVLGCLLWLACRYKTQN